MSPLFQVGNLVGDTGQRHRIAGQEGLALAYAQHQRRTGARADHALRLVAAKHGDGVRALQAPGGPLHSLEDVAVVEVVDQVGDDLGVGLALEVVALGLQLGAQFVMVFDDAVVHQRHARLAVRAGGEMRVRVVHLGRAMRGPAGVGDAGARGHRFLRHLGSELGHARRAAAAAQCAVLVHGHAAGVVATVLMPLQAFDQDRNDVARTDGADNATHEEVSIAKLNGAES